jgi:rare lipoprotein A
MKFFKLPFAAAVVACAFSIIPEAQAAQRGAASWYGPGFHGRRTASGEAFNANAMTAAHRTLPFGTRVRVVNERTGRSVVVRINDRGPYAHGRIIDLAAAPARLLGVKGTSYVSLHVGG